MQFIFEIFPIFLFFIVFKFYDIYAATLAGTIATFVQALFHRGRMGAWNKQQVITLAAFLIFGSMTIYFHNPLFIKWKPTVVFWIFATVIFVTQWITQKPLVQYLTRHLLQGENPIPDSVWRRLNFIWGMFFLTMGAINLYIAYHYSDEIWVNFKFYGITSALVLLSVFQAIYLSRYITDTRSVR